MTVENRNKAYIRYQDPATKSQVVLELCCVEIERLPNTEEEFDARECELDCCEQQFFSTFKTSVNQQTGEFPKKSQPSVPDKKKDDSSTPGKPSVDTPKNPSENGNSGSTTPTTPSENSGTDNGNITPSNPSDNNGNNGTNPSTPSENNGSTDSGNTGNTGTTEPTTPSENNGNTDTGTSTQPSENNGSVTPSQPSDNTGNTDNGNSGNTGTTEPTTPSENGSTEPSENSGDTISLNRIVLQDADNGYSELLEFDVYGKGEVTLGEFIEKELNKNQNGGKLNSDGNFEKNGIVYTSDKIKPNLRDYIYTIKKSNADENSYTYEYIPLKRITTNSSENGNTGTDTGTTQPSDNSGTSTQPDAPTVYNTIKLVSTDDLDEVLMEFNVKGKVGEQVRLGDIISKLSFENRNYFDITEDGKLMKDGVSFTLPDGHSSVLDYMYTIKENWHEENIPLKQQRV